MKRLLLSLFLFGSILAACRPQFTTRPPEVSPTASATAATRPTPSPTDTPPSSLTICAAQLPESLFPYNGLRSPTKTNLLALIYEAPLESVGEALAPAILDRIPSLENEGLRLEAVTVHRGQTVVDAEGNLAVFQPGLAVRPSGCHGMECVILWDGETPLTMDRMVLDFKLKDELTWSDGEPVTAEDSVFSFDLASASEPHGLHWAVDRTDAYQALDEKMVQWVGRPGFTTDDYGHFFWRPLPAHLFKGENLRDDPASLETLAQSPLSYGPFQIQSREPGSIRLQSNPYYYRAGEGLPLLDELVFRMVEGGREAALQALQDGECDILDGSFGWENDLALLTEIEAEGRIIAQAQTGEAWWQLVFGIYPAAYDDLYNPALGDRPNFFGDPKVRRAIAACLDREGMRSRALGEWGQLWPSFLPPEESRLSPEEGILFNPEQASADLEAAGWLDMDDDPATPRMAILIPEIPVGTEFRLQLLTDTTQFQQDMAAIIQESLGVCGISVAVEALPSEELYAPGPEGPLFGRRFDLALIAWGADPALDCQLYLDQAIPSEENQWVGTNISGFAQPDYDRACAAAGLALADERLNAERQAEQAFLTQLPAIPLFSPPQMMVFSSSLCMDERLTNGKGFINVVTRLTGDKNCP